VFLNWLISLNMITSSSIHFPANNIMPCFLWMNNIPLFIFTSLFIHSHVDSIVWIL
jgi:hypothetical protein